MNRFIVGSYWSARKEGRSECASRLYRFLDAIRKESSLFSEWFLKTSTLKQAQKVSLQIYPEALEKYLKTNNGDIGGAPIIELGYSIGIWNGRREGSASFTTTCGGFSERVRNAAVLRFESSEDVEGSALEMMLKSLLEISIATWNPENAVVTTIEHLSKMADKMPWEAGGGFVYQQYSSGEKTTEDRSFWENLKGK